MGHNTCKSMGRVLCVVRRYDVISSCVVWFQEVAVTSILAAIVLVLYIFYTASDSFKAIEGM